MTRGETETTPGIAEQAAAWLVELEDPDCGTHAGFAAWLEASPAHIEEFLLASAVWNALDRIDPDRRIEVSRLVEQARNNVRSLAQTCGAAPVAAPVPAPRKQWTRQWKRVAVVCAVVFLVCAGLFGVMATRSSGGQVYVTARGEQRAFKLEDGSLVQLNTQSRVQVRYTAAARDIRLLEGEAMFTVEHDAARPFRVRANETVIQAVGTRFNVYRTGATTTVSVVEGVVQILPPRPVSAAAPPRVAAGEQARVSVRGEVVREALPDVEKVVAWRERRLVFRGDSLEQVAAEFNRYNALQIEVEGDAARHKRLTGVFDADDPQSLVQFLQADASLTVQASDREVLIRAQPEAKSQ